MCRGVFKIPSVVSLLLCTAIAGLWLGSYWAGAQILYSRSNHLAGFTSTNGYFWFYWGRRYLPNRDGDGFVFRLSDPPARPVDRIGNADEVYIDAQAWGAEYHCFVVDGLKLAMLLLLLSLRQPLILAETHLKARFNASRQSQVTLCSTCGYDLRATPDRCPECGTAVLQKSEQAANSRGKGQGRVR
jgi:hypothetical protein